MRSVRDEGRIAGLIHQYDPSMLVRGTGKEGRKKAARGGSDDGDGKLIGLSLNVSSC
jgi:hypothetical protein